MGLGPAEFVYDKKGDFLLFAAGSLLFSVLLPFLGIGAGELVLLFLCAFFLFGGKMTYEYVRLKRRLWHLSELFASLDRKYLFAEIAGRPSGALERHYFFLLRSSLKAMTDEVAAAQRANREYREFVEQWVHEIKVPLTGIELLCENHKTDAARKILVQAEIVEQNVERALFYARLGNVEKDYLIRPVSLSDCVREAISLNRQFLMQNGVCIETQRVKEAVLSDKKWVVFMLEQVMINSVKYRRDEPCRIVIESADLGDRVRLSVTDNGIGILQDEIGRVFDKGFTGSNGRAAKNSTGIGLYLCRQLCDRLGISLEIESIPGKFTTVSFCFPQNDFYGRMPAAACSSSAQ